MIAAGPEWGPAGRGRMGRATAPQNSVEAPLPELSRKIGLKMEDVAVECPPPPPPRGVRDGRDLPWAVLVPRAGARAVHADAR